MQVLETS